MTFTRHSLLLTVDVEDWFQVENFRPWIPCSSWSSYSLRVEKNTHCILNLLDSVVVNRNGQADKAVAEGSTHPKATFFMLGWIAERLPSLVREITARGHEVASHGIDHRLCSQCSREALRRDISDSKKILEDIVGQPVYGYRAPGFSLTEQALEIARASGYLYDSSINSFQWNGKYGRIDINGLARKRLARKLGGAFYELPVSNIKRAGVTIPIGGGGYFRLLPFLLFLSFVSFYLEKEGDYLFYFHPWELDPGQPRLKGPKASARFRHYYNISRNRIKLSKFIDHFSTSRFTTCTDYLRSLNL